MSLTYECPWTYRALAYANGDDPNDTALRGHLVECSDCRDLVDALAGDRNLIEAAAAKWETQPIPVARMLDRAEKRRRPSMLIPTALTACIVLALFLFARPMQDDAHVSGAIVSATWDAEVDRIQKRLDELEAMTAPLSAPLARDLSSATGDPAWLDEAATAAVFVRAAELLERDFGMHEAANDRYRSAAQYFNATFFGRQAQQRLPGPERTNEG